MPLDLMLTGATAVERPIARIPSAMLLGEKKQALRGKLMILAMPCLSNPPLSFKTAGLRNENG